MVRNSASIHLPTLLIYCIPSHLPLDNRLYPKRSMKNEGKVCRGAVIPLAAVSACLWFSVSTFLSSFSRYGGIDLIIDNSSLIQPLELLDRSSIAWTLLRIQETSKTGNELFLTENHGSASKGVETGLTFLDESVLGIGKGHRATPMTEEEVLLALRHSLEDDPLGLLDSWFTVGGVEGRFCSWIGITCDLARQHVVALNLAGMKLRGAVAKELYYLPFLTTLNLSSNFLHGRIPNELSHCRALRYLDLSKNQLSGPIPPELCDLGFLEGLWLQDNDLSGPLPHTLRTCRRLIVLYLSNNKLTGSIPTNFSQLRRLKIIQLRSNGLTGSVPAALAGCSALSLVDFSKNHLTGIIPPELGKLEHMQTLDLSNNQLSGEIPASLANCTRLTFLSLYNNQLTGVLPTAIVTLRSLVYLSLGRNELSGNILGDLREGVTSNLTYLDLAHNQLTGSIPATFAAVFTLMCYLNLSQNSFSGSLPLEFGRLKSLVSLDLSRNRLVDSIPSEIGDIVSLRHLDLSSNKLSGEVPRSFTSLPDLQVLDLSNNCLTGSISRTRFVSRISYLSSQGNAADLCADNRACSLPVRKLRASKRNTAGLMLVPVTGVLGLVALGVSIWFCAHCNYYGWKGRRAVVDCPEIKCFPTRGFILTAEEVRRATESCKESNIIGRGDFSCVYKVVMTEGRECAVRKIVKNLNYRTQRRLIQELQILGSLRHRNLVKLLAYFFDAQSNVLVYEYMPGGSLEKNLLRAQEICWATRFTIAVDVARALVYLHDGSAFPVVHGSLKPSNIFVNVKCSDVRVGDFGLRRYPGLSYLQEEIGDVSGLERRHEAYTAPEVLHSSRLESIKTSADVYSFGVILLELITGTRPHRYSGRCMSRAEPAECLPPQLEEMSDSMIQSNSSCQQMKRCFRIALLCTNQRPEDRPPMKEVLRMLIQLPGKEL